MEPFNKIRAVSVIMFIHVSLMSAQSRWSAELYGGFAGNIPVSLSVKQSGQPDLDFVAKYESRSLNLPIYYGYRLSKWSGDKSWELEFTHHKIYLSNNPPEIENFSLSHGLNMFTVNRGRKLSGYVIHVGAGPVVTHPEFTIRDVTFDQSRGLFHLGYMLNGIALNLGVAHPIRFSSHFFLNLEAKTTFAYVHLIQDNLNVNAYNWAFHLILGPGYIFRLKSAPSH